MLLCIVSASLMHCVDDPLSIYCIVVVYYTVNGLMRIMCNDDALWMHELCNAGDRGVVDRGGSIRCGRSRGSPLAPLSTATSLP